MSCESPCSLCTPIWYAQAGAPTVQPLRKHGTPWAFTSSGAKYRRRTFRLCPGCAARVLREIWPWAVSKETVTTRSVEPSIPLALEWSHAVE